MAWPWQLSPDRTQDALRAEVILALGQVLRRDGEPAPMRIPPDAYLGADLGLSSLGVARLVGVLQKRCGRKPLPFHALFVKPDGTLLGDIRVSDVVAFLERHLRVDGP